MPRPKPKAREGGYLVDPGSEGMKKLSASLIRTSQRRRCRCHCHDYPDGVVQHVMSCCGMEIRIVESPVLQPNQIICGEKLFEFFDNDHTNTSLA